MNFFPHICNTSCIPDAQRGWKKVLDLLEWMLLSCHMGVRN